MFLSIMLELVCLINNIGSAIDNFGTNVEEVWYATTMFDAAFWQRDLTSILTYEATSIAVVAFVAFLILLVWALETEMERRFPKEA